MQCKAVELVTNHKGLNCTTRNVQYTMLNTELSFKLLVMCLQMGNILLMIMCLINDYAPPKVFIFVNATIGQASSFANILPTN